MGLAVRVWFDDGCWEGRAGTRVAGGCFWVWVEDWKLGSGAGPRLLAEGGDSLVAEICAAGTALSVL